MSDTRSVRAVTVSISIRHRDRAQPFNQTVLNQLHGEWQRAQRRRDAAGNHSQSGAALSDLMRATGLEKGSTGTLRASRSLLSTPSPTLGKFHSMRARGSRRDLEYG